MSRRVYTPRAYADLAMAHFRNHPRCALWAKPGMGKTSMVLTHLDIAHRVWGESEPTLVLGPLRVAQNVWTDEAAKWEHLKGLEVVPIVGTPAERRAALKRDAPVKTLNYENIPWLVEHAKPWPFGRVVADESTKLKSFRLRQGGARAQALARVAHKEVREWVNLTGTPAPNGLVDLWGQVHFLDQGRRLGRTYSAFEERYFAFKRRPGQQFGGERVMLPFAEEQIHRALADICLTLDPKDWFDLHDPVVSIIEVDLPAKARALYKELERDLLIQVGDGTAEAFNAAALSMKCLQLANGAVYLDEQAGRWAVVHDEKLDALESLAEESGEPILVAYQFKSDLARLRERFPAPYGVDLGTAAGMAAFKAGQARLGFGHPAGMGHGVDGLQEHCCTVAIFGHWWDLEQYDQFIERVGPMRQLQSGKDRPVFIHHIVARDTVDEVVVARRGSKRAVQDLLLDHMKGRA